MTNCIEKVFHAYHHYPCGRKAGHGPEEKYCRQHAAKRDTSKPSVQLWKCERYDRMPKPIMVRSHTKASYVDANGNANRKSTEYGVVFDTREEAFAYAIDRVTNALNSARRSVTDAEKELAALQDAAGRVDK